VTVVVVVFVTVYDIGVTVSVVVITFSVFPTVFFFVDFVECGAPLAFACVLFSL